ncbi:MAG: nucleoside hydrolase, partial [Ruminococcus sp.]|nr:nucleoside hydrolase [Ruminococcus sp.]
MVSFFKKTLGLLLSVTLLMSSVTALSSCSNEKAQDTTTDETSASDVKTNDASVKRKIIIDTDTAGDDASALIIAAKAENAEILGVTVSAGNVKLSQAVDNALMTLEMAGSDAPVYA